MINGTEIVMAGSYHCFMDGREVLVKHTRLTTRLYTRHCFYVHCGGITTSIAKEQVGECYWWTGAEVLQVAGLTGAAIEMACGMVLPPQPCFNPFARYNYPAEKFECFEVEGMRVEKAAAVYEEVEAFYYRAASGSDPHPVISCFRLPMNTLWEWRPVTIIPADEFNMLQGLIASWESGEYQQTTRISEAFARLLRR